MQQSTPQNKPEWEERFYKLFGKDKYNPFNIDVPTVKEFISSLLAERDAEIRKRIIEAQNSVIKSQGKAMLESLQERIIKG